MGLRRTLMTLGLGAGLMYLYDPEHGEKRREELTEQIANFRSNAQETWSQTSGEVQHRARMLREQPSSLAQGFVREGGVKGNWPPEPRLLTTVGGAALSLYGLARGGLRGFLFTGLGLNLVARGATGKDMRALWGGETGNGINTHKQLTVNAPISEVFAFWRNYENFPQFMSHVREVRDMGGGRSHWVVEGPAGVPIEWDAEITQMQPDRMIAWESLPEAEVRNGGRVMFTPMPGDATQVDVRLWYNPPAGELGHAFATLFGSDPQTAMDDDMLRFKGLVEEAYSHSAAKSMVGGEARGHVGQSKQSRKAGKGRVDEVGHTGVFPASDLSEAPADAETQGMASWGQGDLGAAGYEESGTSELNLGMETGFDSVVPGNPIDEAADVDVNVDTEEHRDEQK